MNATGTGIGRALQRARESRGKSLDQASRETRIRAEYLQALEREAFDRLLGDVYVRGFLRSYASYLGLDADKVLTAYTRSHGGHRPTSAPPPASVPTATANPDGHPLIHRPANWRLAAVAAVGVLGVLAVVALASRTGGNPEDSPRPQASVEPSSPPVLANVVAFAAVDARIVADGNVVFEGRLAKGEARSFTADDTIRISFADGGVVDLSVNGRKLGRAGPKGSPFDQEFGPGDFRRTPSNGG